jgi:hypothetical protein
MARRDNCMVTGIQVGSEWYITPGYEPNLLRTQKSTSRNLKKVTTGWS